MLIRRPPFTVFDTFRRQMLTAFGQWVIECKPTPVETEAEIAATISAMRSGGEVRGLERESRILAAINSGVGLVPAAKEAAEAEALGFDDEHLRALIELLETQISSRQDMLRALEAHLGKRINPSP